MKNDPKNFNVIFVTLCSCTLEAAQKAKTPFLSKLSKLKEAETTGTYTYPAHHSFFIGHLPELSKDPYYFSHYGRIWRSRSAWRTGKKVAIWYEADNIIDFYEKRGFNVQGFGGVGFFNTNDPHNSLPKLFKNFTYFGKSGKPVSQKRVPRDKQIFPLMHSKEIANKVKGKAPYFIFINCPETHIPYDHPGTKIKNFYSKAIKKLYYAHYTKKNYSKSKIFTDKDLEEFKNQQKLSLEWIDKKLENLVNILPKERPLLVLVCGDHGEEFGENGRFGHIHFHPNIMRVPLWCGVIK